MDYLSNALSMDPVNIFKDQEQLEYKNGKIFGYDKQSIFLNCTLVINRLDQLFPIGDDILPYTDVIYYSNGIYDKLFYDTSLTNAQTLSPSIDYLEFRFLNLTFKEPDSIFYFKDNINFVGSMWDNLRI